MKRVFQTQWFGKWDRLHYDCSQDLIFCHTCISAFKTGKLKLSTGNVKDLAFLFVGFSNWKDATVAFVSHEKSATHKRAMEGVSSWYEILHVIEKVWNCARTNQ